jgi:hypothetical protein
MSDSKKIESLVEQTVAEILNQAVPGLHQEIVRRVMEHVTPALTTAPVASGDSSVLSQALASIQAGATQVQILDALVDGAAIFTARTALYVVRGANAVGWRARGFADDDAVRNNPVELTLGLPAAAIAAREAVAGPADEFLYGFSKKFGAPQQDCLAFPLVVRDKVVAIIYADGGTAEHRMDRPALEALVRTTGLWLEVFATRKVTATPQMHPATAAAAAGANRAAAASPAPVVAAAAMEARQTTVSEEAPVVAPPPTSTPAAGGQEDEIHKKARRFAKLLVDEIKLYNQTKVAEGKHHRDLYDRLHDDIEKSRASYDKRYGNTAAKDGDYFNQELVRILADNDPQLLGGNFPR